MRAPAIPRITFLNAHLSGGQIGSVRIEGSRIAGVGEPPRAGDLIIDIEGDRLLPGLINAHDHLQLNTLPRRAGAKRYGNARTWAADVDAGRACDPALAAGLAIAREERLLLGGIKNLLSGATTVAHHDPCYPGLLSEEYPTQVVRDYGWSHSLYIDGEERVQRSRAATPPSTPWIIHAAEGIDAESGEEFERLEALGCIGANTLLVHGVALGGAQRSRLLQAGAALIWCPSSNTALFGRTAQVSTLSGAGRVALGTDSRLSGSRDLLEELRIAAALGGIDGAALEALVTRDAARLLRLTDRGELRAGARADLLILPAGQSLAAASRADVRLVLIGGVVRYGDEALARRADPASPLAQVRVDGRAKVLDGALARRLTRAAAREPGLELPHPAWRAA